MLDYRLLREISRQLTAAGVYRCASFVLVELDNRGLRTSVVDSTTGISLLERGDRKLTPRLLDLSMADYLVQSGRVGRPETLEWANELIGLFPGIRERLNHSDGAFAMGPKHVGLFRVSRRDYFAGLQAHLMAAQTLWQSTALNADLPVGAIVFMPEHTRWPGLYPTLSHLSPIPTVALADPRPALTRKARGKHGVESSSSADAGSTADTVASGAAAAAGEREAGEHAHHAAEEPLDVSGVTGPTPGTPAGYVDSIESLVEAPAATAPAEQVPAQPVEAVTPEPTPEPPAATPEPPATAAAAPVDADAETAPQQPVLQESTLESRPPWDIPAASARAHHRLQSFVIPPDAIPVAAPAPAAPIQAVPVPAPQPEPVADTDESEPTAVAAQQLFTGHQLFTEAETRQAAHLRVADAEPDTQSAAGPLHAAPHQPIGPILGAHTPIPPIGNLHTPQLTNTGEQDVYADDESETTAEATPEEIAQAAEVVSGPSATTTIRYPFAERQPISIHDHLEVTRTAGPRHYPPPPGDSDVSEETRRVQNRRLLIGAAAVAVAAIVGAIVLTVPWLSGGDDTNDSTGGPGPLVAAQSPNTPVPTASAPPPVSRAPLDFGPARIPVGTYTTTTTTAPTPTAENTPKPPPRRKPAPKCRTLPNPIPGLPPIVISC
ncbi:hypothetical protein [Williamsia sp. CHRR-6]|uniref:hypothetical protein n=1 Tax=Williamsia sp. CHRR-6 TaxID=2835871 RepID=UPI001BDB1EF7|nr:hypothetical protein [Williamsia sp. CHRR-6]MBT0566296.1 hypothetical protein [Williamsia sp. CHRR-6]